MGPVEVYPSPSTQAAYKRILSRYILLELGDRRFDEVTRREVKAFHTRLYDGASAAESVLSLIGRLYTWIIDDWELCEMRNPTAGIKRRPSRRVERFLSPEERRAVVTANDTAVKLPRGRKGHIEQASAWALMLLMLTGQRRNEILTLTRSFCQDSRLKAHLVRADMLKNVSSDTVRTALCRRQDSAKAKIRELREEPSSFPNGRLLGLYTMLHSNASLALYDF